MMTYQRGYFLESRERVTICAAGPAHLPPSANPTTGFHLICYPLASHPFFRIS
jgi:hypothetical protein